MNNFLTRPIPGYPERNFKKELTAPWTTSETIRASIIGALFFGLIIAFLPFAWGPIQFRVADILDFTPFDRKYGGRAAFVGLMAGSGAALFFNPYGPIEIMCWSSGFIVFGLIWYLGIKSKGQWWGKFACIPVSIGFTLLFISYIMLHRIFGLPLMEVLVSVGIEMVIIDACCIALLSALERTYVKRVTIA